MAHPASCQLTDKVKVFEIGSSTSTNSPLRGAKGGVCCAYNLLHPPGPFQGGNQVAQSNSIDGQGPPVSCS